MDQGLATVLAALVAALVATSGYGALQAIARRDRQARRFADAFGAAYEFQQVPFHVLRRGASDPATRQAIGDIQIKASSTVRYHAALLSVEAPLAAAAYHVLFDRMRSRSAVFSAWAWVRQPASSDEETSVLAPFWYGYDEEVELLMRAMRLELKWLPQVRRRKMLKDELAALKDRRAVEVEANILDELDKRHLTAAALIASSRGRQKGGPMW